MLEGIFFVWTSETERYAVTVAESLKKGALGIPRAPFLGLGRMPFIV
tara:strand:- start:397 stop:537 length:141 start_codon:yes stop_codon:yes gene_type:complete